MGVKCAFVNKDVTDSNPRPDTPIKLLEKCAGHPISPKKRGWIFAPNENTSFTQSQDVFDRFGEPKKKTTQRTGDLENPGAPAAGRLSVDQCPCGQRLRSFGYLRDQRKMADSMAGEGSRNGTNGIH